MLERYDSLCIDGQWHKPAEALTIPVISPVRDQQIHTAPLASAADLDLAVAGARRALRSDAWAPFSREERSAARSGPRTWTPASRWRAASRRAPSG